MTMIKTIIDENSNKDCAQTDFNIFKPDWGNICVLYTFVAMSVILAIKFSTDWTIQLIYK